MKLGSGLYYVIKKLLFDLLYVLISIGQFIYEVNIVLNAVASVLSSNLTLFSRLIGDINA